MDLFYLSYKTRLKEQNKNTCCESAFPQRNAHTVKIQRRTRKCVTARAVPWWGGALCQDDTAGHLSPLPSMYDSRWQNIWRRQQRRCLCKVGKGQRQAACDHGLARGHAGCRLAPAGRCCGLHWRGKGRAVPGTEGGGTLSEWPSHLNTLRQPPHLMRQIAWKKMKTRSEPGLTWMRA